MQVLYDIGVRVFYLVMWLSSAINPKTKKWIEGQSKDIPQLINKSIWIHCASLGEYNQAKPLISRLENDGYNIVLSFFSPSGYQHVKTPHPFFYIPIDTYQNAQRFIKQLNPALAIFVRSEYWYNHMRVLNENNVPLVFLNCFLSEEQYLFKWYGNWFLEKIKRSQYIYTINDSTGKLLSSRGFTQHSNLGDTKVDHVKGMTPKPIKINFNSEKKKVILIASIEPGDHDVVKILLEKYLGVVTIILVPHEHTDQVYHYFKNLSNGKLLKYSQADEEVADIIYVDKFGLLPSLYQFAWVSYIGGGFNKGVHNILESCIENKPMIFGPQHNKFPEAQALVNVNAAKSIDQPNQILDVLNYFENEDVYTKAEAACKHFISTNDGATDKIYDHLKSNFLTA